MTYRELKPFLRAYKIILRDREYNTLTESKAMRRLVDNIQAGHVRPDELIITMK